MIKFELSQVSDRAALIELEQNEMEPSDLAYLEFPVVEETKGLIVAGFDSWVIAAIVAECRDRAIVDWNH
ncbi:hypothetical protein [Scytonema sp. PCC 10023]|uniref:hypothetical protein n=1 Tax=Scytonema sp. PCC 10023 TaxID=1680591 RepID=UPI0039C69271